MTSTRLELFGHTMKLRTKAGALTESRWADGQPIDDTIDLPDRLILEEARRQLLEFAAGTRRKFDLPFAPEGTEFRKKVWEELLRIPYGETITYAQLARRIGRPKAFRAVANACGANPLPVFIPCHRVVASGGKTGGYTGGLDIKLALLEIESCYKIPT